MKAGLRLPTIGAALFWFAALPAGTLAAADIPGGPGGLPPGESMARELVGPLPAPPIGLGEQRRIDPPLTLRIARPDASWARITIDRAPDLVGQPAFRVQSGRLGTGVVIRFADRPGFSGSGSPASLPGRLPLAARLSSSFGWRGHPVLGGYRAHLGVDLAAPWGTPVRATSDGVVRFAGWQGGYGLLVALDHAAGLETRYAHLSQLGVGRGQSVRSGDVIGFVGSTGRSTGAHLHYETRIYGTAVDPLQRR